jgi:hypothetical protein
MYVDSPLDVKAGLLVCAIVATAIAFIWLIVFIVKKRRQSTVTENIHDFIDVHPPVPWVILDEVNRNDGDHATSLDRIHDLPAELNVFGVQPLQELPSSHVIRAMHPSTESPRKIYENEDPARDTLQFYRI